MAPSTASPGTSARVGRRTPATMAISPNATAASASRAEATPPGAERRQQDADGDERRRPQPDGDRERGDDEQAGRALHAPQDGAPHAAIPGNTCACNYVFPDMTAHLLTLPGGERFMVRPIEADDKPGITDFFARLSEESRRRRFLGPKPKLSSRDLAFLTEVDQRRHVAIVALDGAGAIVGVARYAAWVGRAGAAPTWRSPSSTSGTATASAPRSATSWSRRRAPPASPRSPARRSPTTRPAKALLKRLGFRPKGISSGVADYELAFAPS